MLVTFLVAVAFGSAASYLVTFARNRAGIHVMQDEDGFLRLAKQEGCTSASFIQERKWRTRGWLTAEDRNKGFMVVQIRVVATGGRRKVSLIKAINTAWTPDRRYPLTRESQKTLSDGDVAANQLGLRLCNEIGVGKLRLLA